MPGGDGSALPHPGTGNDDRSVQESIPQGKGIPVQLKQRGTRSPYARRGADGIYVGTSPDGRRSIRSITWRLRRSSVLEPGRSIWSLVTDQGQPSAATTGEKA